LGLSKVLERRILRALHGPKKQNVTEGWRKFLNRERDTELGRTCSTNAMDEITKAEKCKES
jgi:hypothetical protein